MTEGANDQDAMTADALTAVTEDALTRDDRVDATRAMRALTR